MSDLFIKGLDIIFTLAGGVIGGGLAFLWAGVLAYILSPDIAVWGAPMGLLGAVVGGGVGLALYESVCVQTSPGESDEEEPV